METSTQTHVHINHGGSACTFEVKEQLMIVGCSERVKWDQVPVDIGSRQS